MGADRGLHVELDTVELTDSMLIASLIRSVADREKVDMIWCGRHTIDDQNMHIQLWLPNFLIGRMSIS